MLSMGSLRARVDSVRPALAGLARPRPLSTSHVCSGLFRNGSGSDFAKENRPKSESDTDYMTTNTGMPVFDNRNSLTVGDRGPMIMEDMHYLEKLGNFDRERIPERVVHARGAAAKGFFEVTHDVRHLTCADFLQHVGNRTPVITRFSMVTHPSGSPENLRDTRGFAVKFYTSQGNYDLVGNNMPVFFVRDGISFPDIIHALKPNPKTNFQEDWRILDFMSHHPEGLNMMTWLLDDVGIPQDYRHMEGFGVHTFKLINKHGKATYVKFHWRPKQGVVLEVILHAAKGVQNLIHDEDAWAVGGKDHNHATRDLYLAIDRGDAPEWEFLIQTMDPATENDYDFDPLDPTRTWPEDQFPLQPVGRMVLNHNVDNFFAETESLAFQPAAIVPGIEFSDDKLLQSRIFSYGDTQRYRLGANYLQLPVNAPKCPFHNNHFDGQMNPIKRTEEVNYFPSKFHSKWQQEAPRYPTDDEVVSGPKVKQHLSSKIDDFKEPRERYLMFDPDRRSRFEDRLVKQLMDPRAESMRASYIQVWSKVHPDLGRNLAAKMEEKAKQLSKMHA